MLGRTPPPHCGALRQHAAKVGFPRTHTVQVRCCVLVGWRCHAYGALRSWCRTLIPTKTFVFDRLFEARATQVRRRCLLVSEAC